MIWTDRNRTHRGRLRLAIERAYAARTELEAATELQLGATNAQVRATLATVERLIVRLYKEIKEAK